MSCDTKIKNAILVNEFTEFGVKSFKCDFDELKNSTIPVIPVIIDSFGGEVYSLLAMIDIILTSDRPVATIALGKAMSCGSLLLAAGTPGYRFVGPNATIMVHDVATVSIGKIEELKADVGEGDRLNQRIFRMLDKYCNKSSGHFQKIIAQKKHANWYLDANETLKHGLADHIGLPVIDALYNIDIAKEKNEKVVLRAKRRSSKKSGK